MKGDKTKKIQNIVAWLNTISDCMNCKIKNNIVYVVVNYVASRLECIGNRKHIFFSKNGLCGRRLLRQKYTYLLHTISHFGWKNLLPFERWWQLKFDLAFLAFKCPLFSTPSSNFEEMSPFWANAFQVSFLDITYYETWILFQLKSVSFLLTSFMAVMVLR